MIQYKYFAEYSKEEINNSNVISCINEDGFHSILIKNTNKKTTQNQLSTDNLLVKLNTVLSLDGIDYYFHIISARNNDYLCKMKFDIIFEYVFSKIIDPISDTNLSVLINSLEELFKITPEPDTYKMQVGVFGELLFVKSLYENGYPLIVEKYHKNFYSKHDVEINEKFRIEIKTTSKENRIHSFGHLQIHRTDINVFVTSIKLESVQEGFSLYEMFEYIISLYNDPDSIFELRKLMAKCNVNNDNHGLKFNLSLAENNMKYYDAKSLPQLNVEDTPGVSNIHYDVDCDLSNSLELNEFINILNANS